MERKGKGGIKHNEGEWRRRRNRIETGERRMERIRKREGGLEEEEDDEERGFLTPASEQRETEKE